MQILLWALFLVIMWNWGGLTRGKTLRRRGLAHDNSANNRRKVWRNGKLRQQIMEYILTSKKQASHVTWKSR